MTIDGEVIIKYDWGGVLGVKSHEVTSIKRNIIEV